MTESPDRVFLHKNFGQFLKQITQLKVAQFECFDEFVDHCAIADTAGESCEQYCLNRRDRHVCACYSEFYLDTDLRSCKERGFRILLPF